MPKSPLSSTRCFIEKEDSWWEFSYNQTYKPACTCTHPCRFRQLPRWLSYLFPLLTLSHPTTNLVLFKVMVYKYKSDHITLKTYCFVVLLGYSLRSLPYLQSPVGDGFLSTSPSLTDNSVAILHSPAIPALFDCLQSAKFLPGSSFWNAFFALPS